MKAITVIASPRMEGNCRKIVDSITEGINENNGENKIYKYILITNLVGLVLQFLCDYVSYKYDVISPVISDFILRIYLVYFIIFISL